MALRSQQVWLSSSTALQHSRRFPMLSLLHRRFVASYAGKQVAKGVPVIDVSELCHTPDKDLSAEMKVCRDIRDACSEWGFFQAINAPISNSLLFRYYAQKQAFFALPIKAKERVRRTASNSKGWYDDELTKQKRDWKEGFDVGAQNGSLDVSGLDGENQWPMEGGKGEGEGGFCGFENTVREYYDANERFARSLTCAMAVGLGLQPEALVKDSFDACHTSYLRMNYYPPCPEPDAHMAISHHTDAGAVTVLSQSAVQSLQVQSREDGSWWDVKPIPGAFVINTGDVMQVWSNDIYKAPVHRVKAQLGLLRYSSPFSTLPNLSPLSVCRYQAYMNKKCVAAKAASNTSFLCLVPHVSYPYFDVTPMFIIESLIDPVVLGGFEGLPAKPIIDILKKPEVDYINAYGHNASLNFLQVIGSKKDGIFAADCLVHTGFQQNKPLINGQNAIDAFYSWVAHTTDPLSALSSDPAAYQWVDDCPAKHGHFFPPCNHHCPIPPISSSAENTQVAGRRFDGQQAHFN